MAILELEKVNTFIGTVQVLRNVSIKVEKGEIVCLLGRNGAGKTSTIKTTMGLLSPKSGKVTFKNEDITKLPPYKRARRGIGLAPDYRGVFTDLTVWENINYPKMVIGEKNLSNDLGVDFEKVTFTIFPELNDLKDRSGLVLSGGEGKMVATARALMLRPSLLVLDEPLEGLAPIIKGRFAERIKKIRDLGVSILTAESNLPNAAKIANKVYIIERGEIIFEGTTDEIAKDEKLRMLISG